MAGTNFYTAISSTCDVALVEEGQLAMLAKCTGTPPTTANVFEHGCIMTQTDSGSGNAALYENTGTSAIPVWNLIGSISPGELTLAEGNLLVGQASGLGGAVDFSTNAQIGVGDGTTFNSVVVGGEATIDNTGAVTLGTTAVTGKALTGFVQGAGVVAATDTILEAFNKIDGNVAALSAAGVGGTLTDAHIIVGDGTNTAADVAMSGDVSIDNTGATTVESVDLETATLTNIADTEILIGTGAGTANFAAMSGDATMANTGAVTVTGSTGAFAVGTTFGTGSTTASTGAGAVAITGAIHEITTTGTGDALTLADGAEGQHLFVVYVAEAAGGDTAVCTPTNLAGASTTITFNAIGDSAHLLFTAGTWFFLGGAAAVA